MAVGNINLSQVNISLAKFQKMSDGKYNAGEVRLSSATGLKKVNNHIHRLGANSVEIPHEEVLAIKEAFVRALSSGGVADKKELNRIRGELGLAPDSAVDTSLRQRSLRPLTRQQIRDIIDRNAAALRAADQNGTIRTSNQLYGSLSDAEKTRRAGKREEAAEARFRQAAVDENRSITLFQEMIGGTADFQIPKTRETLQGIAQRQAAEVMKACNGNPSPTKECVLFFKTESGATIEMPTGLSEKKFLDTLDSTFLRLRNTTAPSKDMREARHDFVQLATDERRQYFRQLSDDAVDRCKARTALVAILQERGIDDYATLSVVNKLPLSRLKLMGETLLVTLKDGKGDALRNTQFMRLVAGFARNAPEAPVVEQTFIPAFPPEKYNHHVDLAITQESDKLPPGIRRLMEQLRADMHARFGDAVPADKDLSDMADNMDVSNFCNALAAEGKLATVDNLRETLANAVLNRSMRECIYNAAPQFLDKYGGGNRMQFTSLARSVCPELVAELRAAKNPAEASAAIGRHSATLDRIAARMGPCSRNEKKIVGLYQEAFAREMGLPVDSEVVKRVGTVRIESEAGSLTNEICGGERPLDTEEEIGAAFEKLASDRARQRASLIRKAGTLCQSPISASILRRHLLVVARPDKFDFDKFKAEAEKMKPQAEKVAHLIDSNASVDDICNAIGDIFLTCKNRVCDIYKKGPLNDVGPDDFFAYGLPMQILALDSVPGLMDKIQTFFAREDVKALDFDAANGPAANAESLRYALDRAAELPVPPGAPGKDI
jgi:hypothetical protein